MRRIVPVLMILALASSAWAQAPQDTTRDLTAIKADVEQIKADLAAVKSQLDQLIRLLSQRPADGRIATSGPVRTSLGGAPMLGRADARTVGVDGSKFDECLSSGRHATRVDRGLADGAVVGVQGTPTFVVGKTTPGDFVEGTLIRGAQPLETFRRIIDQTLAEQ